MHGFVISHRGSEIEVFYNNAKIMGTILGILNFAVDMNFLFSMDTVGELASTGWLRRSPPEVICTR